MTDQLPLVERLPDPASQTGPDDPPDSDLSSQGGLWQEASRSMAEYLASLEPIDQQMAVQLYGQGRRQTEVAQQFQVSQPTVARCQRRILSGLVRCLQPLTGGEHLTSQTLATLKPSLVAWLQYHYGYNTWP